MGQDSFLGSQNGLVKIKNFLSFWERLLLMYLSSQEELSEAVKDKVDAKVEIYLL